MITSPESGISQSSTQETSRASQSSMQDLDRTYFTFWDMDDTSVDLNTNLIKNPHLLLPIKLFQTYAPNQHLGIMTNRTPEDTDTDYPVKQYIAELSRFGIIIPSSQIIFGGGQNNRPQLNELRELTAAVEIIRKQLDSLALTVGPAFSAKIFGTEAKTPFDQLIEAKFSGKNFLVNDFLKNAFDKDTEQFHFAKGGCHRTALMVCLVDDLDKIAGVTSQLGENFVGIKAARGGKSPGDLEILIPNDDFYQDDYLFVLANNIGLTSYAKQLLEKPSQPEQNNAMLQMAALLYAWQAFPEQTNCKSFVHIAKKLSPMQLEQMAQLLSYIQHHANTHSSAHYRPVNKIANYFRHAADEVLLETASEMLISLKQRILTLSAVQPALSEEAVPESVKPKKSLAALFKARSVASLKPIRAIVDDERAQELAQLKQEEQALIDRVAGLLRSPDLKFASQAQKLLGTIVESGTMVLLPMGPSFNSSSGSPVSSSSSASFPRQAPTSPLFPGLSRHRLSSSSSPKPVFASRTVVSDPLPLSASPTNTDQGNSEPHAVLEPKKDKRLEM